jgi:hypothetical protein
MSSKKCDWPNSDCFFNSCRLQDSSLNGKTPDKTIAPATFLEEVCSIVVPLYNEALVIEELYARLTKTMLETGLNYEIVFVDDGSSPGARHRRVQSAREIGN